MVDTSGLCALIPGEPVSGGAVRTLRKAGEFEPALPMDDALPGRMAMQ